MKSVYKEIRVYCSCCSKQFVSYETSSYDPTIVNSRSAVRLWGDKWACKYCAKDLDEDGLFPEERH